MLSFFFCYEIVFKCRVYVIRYVVLLGMVEFVVQ